MRCLNREENAMIQNYSQFILFYFTSIYNIHPNSIKKETQKSEYDKVSVDFYLIYSFFLIPTVKKERQKK